MYTCTQSDRLGTVVQRNLPNTDFKQSIRKMIIFHEGDKPLVLYEGKLAENFGVSRTPIRQVLQSLASEWLVEIRVGVGTVSTSLLPENADRDVRSFAAVLRACSLATNHELTETISMDLSTVEMVLNAKTSEVSTEQLFDISCRLVNALGLAVNDEILRDTMVACFWRFFRRLVAGSSESSNLALSTVSSTTETLVKEFRNGKPELAFTNASVDIEKLIPLPEHS